MVAKLIFQIFDELFADSDKLHCCTKDMILLYSNVKWAQTCTPTLWISSACFQVSSRVDFRNDYLLRRVPIRIVVNSYQVYTYDTQWRDNKKRKKTRKIIISTDSYLQCSTKVNFSRLYQITNISLSCHVLEMFTR